MQLADCQVTNIREENFIRSGCPTCDYDSQYGVEYLFEFSDGTKEEFRLTDMYTQPVSEGTMMKFLLNNAEVFKTVTKEEFLRRIKDVSQLKPYQDKEDLYSSWR